MAQTTGTIRKRARRNKPALARFHYENGYVLRGTDLGRIGTKIELLDGEHVSAIILPPSKAAECARWLLQTLGPTQRNLPEDFPEILQRVLKHKGPKQPLKRGDKKKIKDALKVLHPDRQAG